MPANTSPIFTLSPNMAISLWTSALTANVKSDGAGTIATDMVKAVTGAANGTFVSKLRFCPCASVAATATTASVIRVYLSSVGSGATTRTDTTLLAEIAAPAQTAAQTTTATNFLEVPLGIIVPTGYYLHWSMHHAAAANTSWTCVPFAGDY